jgi:N utilization substance protein B
LVFHEEFYDVLEEQSIYWNDEVDFIISIVGSLIKKINPRAGYVPLPPVYKNEEDEEYTKTLFRKTIVHFDEHKKYIDMFTTNWDVDRIAFFDNLIMAQAITEMTEFPSIPVKVTFNEYLEVAKYYSTRNSSNFVNGVLDKILHTLREENKIQKTGRGLLE